MSELPSIEAPNFVPPKPKIFTIGQAAKFLGKSKGSVRYQIEQGHLATVKRTVPAITEAELERFKRENLEANQG